eukprot:2448633-Amphidinium_carterae.1
MLWCTTCRLHAWPDIAAARMREPVPQLTGGGWTKQLDAEITPLSRAQELLVLPQGFALHKSLPNGNCLYHSLLAAAADTTTRNKWTVESLRRLAHHDGPDYPTEEMT